MRPHFFTRVVGCGVRHRDSASHYASLKRNQVLFHDPPINDTTRRTRAASGTGFRLTCPSLCEPSLGPTGDSGGSISHGRKWNESIDALTLGGPSSIKIKASKVSARLPAPDPPPPPLRSRSHHDLIRVLVKQEVERKVLTQNRVELPCCRLLPPPTSTAGPQQPSGVPTHPCSKQLYAVVESGGVWAVVVRAPM